MRVQNRLRSEKGSAAKHASRVLKLELEATQALLQGLDTPRALTVSLLLKYEEWDQYLSLGISPSNYLTWQSFSDDYQATEILKKNPRLPTSIDKRAVAISKFYDAEALCKETNQRIQNFREDPRIADADVMHTVLRAQRIIQRILGSHPTSDDLRFCEESMRFGPGATTSTSGIVTQGRKFSNFRLDTTEDLVSYRAFAFPHQWRSVVKELRVVPGSKLTTVPKNAKTDRCICIEPDLNIFVQLGIGALLRSKLKFFGLDLSSQERNQSMASKAWTSDLATLDLSAASDTVSIETVKLLLPPWWVELLAYPRCPSTTVDGQLVTLEKWSSMGNGYTFELETVLFYALSLASSDHARRHDITVYGDDIVVPNDSTDLLIRTLNFLGFKVNSEKSFGKGIFHESCGTDWFMGRNVRPFYLKSDLHDFPSICYLYANNARRWANRRNGGWTCDSRCLPFWLRCLRAVGAKSVLHIPEGAGDGGFVVDFDVAKPPRRYPYGVGWGGYWFTYRRTSCVERVISQAGCLLADLSGRGGDFTRGREALRGRHSRAVTKLGHTHVWPNLGPWC